MEQKRVSFKIAKAIKDAGYNEPCDMYYHIYDDEYESESSLEITGNGCNDFYNSLNRYRCACPTFIDVWLWLWREKKIFIETVVQFDSVKGCYVTARIVGYYMSKHIETSDPEEAIAEVIEFLVENDLIK